MAGIGLHDSQSNCLSSTFIGSEDGGINRIAATIDKEERGPTSSCEYAFSINGALSMCQRWFKALCVHYFLQMLIDVCAVLTSILQISKLKHMKSEKLVEITQALVQTQVSRIYALTEGQTVYVTLPCSVSLEEERT